MSNIFDIYSGKKVENADTALTEELVVYEAFTMTETTNPKWLMLYQGKGKAVFMMAYSHLIGIEFHSETKVSIIFTDSYFILEGENLYGLIAVLENQEATALGAYSEEEYGEFEADD